MEVTVQDGVITNIDILEHKNGRGKSAEVVADRIMEEQKIDVDAVSRTNKFKRCHKESCRKCLPRVQNIIVHEVGISLPVCQPLD